MSGRKAIVHRIQERISSGTLSPGMRLPSERSLATEMGVSRASVQSALRELESLGLLLRQPNCRPLVLPTRSKFASGGVRAADQIAIWILPDMQDLGGAMMLQGIRSVFGTGNYRLLIGCPPSYEKDVVQRAEIEFLRSLVENPNIAGAIIWDTGNPGCNEAYQEIVGAGVPLVFIDREPRMPVAADVVAVNNRRAAKGAVRHLIELGHRRIAMMVSADRASSVQERVEGYRAALREAEIASKESWVIEVPLGDGAARAAEQTLIRLLNSNEPPTAVFALNDRIALHLLEAAKSLKVRIPERLSLVGFDWLLRWLPSGGELTTVSQPFDEIGRTAAQRVLDRIGPRAGESPRQILLDAPLVIKQTTAPMCPHGQPAMRTLVATGE
jgi:LacI family transcriptional regulator